MTLTLILVVYFHTTRHHNIGNKNYQSKVRMFYLLDIKTYNFQRLERVTKSLLLRLGPGYSEMTHVNENQPRHALVCQYFDRYH